MTSVPAIALGGVAVLLAARFISPFLFGVPARDPRTLAGITLLLTAMALLAGYLPGRRAASIDPVRALKGD